MTKKMKFETLASTAALSVLLLATSGCSNPLSDPQSSVDPGYGPVTTPPAQPASTGFEAVSGAKLAQRTITSHHTADVTVGAPTTEIRLKTTKQRTIFLNVQGQIVSK